MSGSEPMKPDLPLLDSRMLAGEGAGRLRDMQSLPVKVLQIGEGNFLRGFADWMLHRCNMQGLFNGSVAVTQPRPSGRVHIDQLRTQEGLYTVLLRGLEKGERVEGRETVGVFSRMVDPYQEWRHFLELAEFPDLEFVISNTTEAGLSYQPSERNADEPVLSFPGKLAAFLYRRYERFGGDPGKGLIHLPCELLDRNGERLREIVLRHARDWRLPEKFQQWVLDSNRFLNTLVDRIVTGYPAEEADDLFAGWGCRDALLTAAEPYHLWAIEAEPELDERLPLRKAGLNVHWVPDLSPYLLRKVRILNGAHTMMASVGLLHGLQEVREAVEHPVWGKKFVRAIFEEIVPGVPLDPDEIKRYAEETLDRFRNPFIRHRLSDINKGGLDKWKVRLLPSLKNYVIRTGTLPALLTESLAAVLKLNHPDVKESTPVKLLADVNLWGEDLTRIPGLTEAIASYLQAEEGQTG